LAPGVASTQSGVNAGHLAPRNRAAAGALRKGAFGVVASLRSPSADARDTVNSHLQCADLV